MDHLDPELLSAYIDNELSPAETAQVETHLGACEICQAEFEELRGVSSLVRQLPIYLPKRTIEVDASGRSEPSTILRIVEFSKPVAIAAVVLLVAFAGLRLFIASQDDGGDSGDPVSFSAVDSTATAGTDSADRASDTTAAEAPAAMDQEAAGEAAQMQEAAADEQPAVGAFQESGEPDSDEEAPPLGAMAPPAQVAPSPATPPSTPIPTAAVAPDVDAARDASDDTDLVAAGIVVVVVVLLGAAASWYVFFRSPRRPRG